MSKGKVKAISEEIQHAAITDQVLTRNQLREYLYRDLQGVHLVLSDLLRSKECIEALADVFYKRYMELKLEKESKPELEFPDAD